jgi:hypothetical protein
MTASSGPDRATGLDAAPKRFQDEVDAPVRRWADGDEFEYWQRYPWYVAQGLRAAPRPSSNAPPGNPLVDPEALDTFR